MNGLVEVSKLAECKKCGSKMVAWLKSKNDKWYLVEANITSDRHFVAQRFNFHKCPAAAESEKAS